MRGGYYIIPPWTRRPRWYEFANDSDMLRRGLNAFVVVARSYSSGMKSQITVRLERSIVFVAMLVVGLLTVCEASLQAQSYGLSQRFPIGPYLDGALPATVQVGEGWQAVEAFPNLTFDNAACLSSAPGTNRLFVCEREGRIYSFENNPSTTNKTLFLDLSAVTQVVTDSGLLGIVFHPEYGLSGSTNRGYVYVWYSYSPSPVVSSNEDTPSYNRLSRFRVPDGWSAADPTSELVLINQFDRHTWHNGGGMFFGPDGFLYLTNGDEGGAYDEYGAAQSLTGGLFSGVLRIDVDMDPGTSHPIRRQPLSAVSPPSGWPSSYSSNYFIPDDNPWLDANGDLLEEFYAVGLRSPHRMSFDPPTGRIWVGDVGQHSREEVDLIVKGGNYQWPYMEGTVSGSKAKPGNLIGFDVPPVHDYPREDGWAVIGGHVYRGAEHAASLAGQYIFGDNVLSSIWAMSYDGVNPPDITFLCTMPGTAYTGLSTFGVDQNGELFMCKMGLGAKIYKLGQFGPAEDAPPALLSMTGAFTNLASLAPNPALVPFDVNSPLWSDGAAKARWMAVPNDGAPYGADEVVEFTTNGSWSWPVGSVLIKHFELPLSETNPSVIKRLETRFMVHGSNGAWYGLTYKWRNDESDADLLQTSLNETNLVLTSSGVRSQVWYYPSQQDCVVCHNPNAEEVLGPKTAQLNGDFTYPLSGVTDNQLRSLSHIGMFDTVLMDAEIPLHPSTVALMDTNATLEHRVRSYLDANCAHCHRPNGVQAFFDARFDTALDQQGLINGLVQDSMGISGAKVIVPQSPGQSILYVRDGLVGQNQMPPLARNVIDENYMDVLTEWINSLTEIGGLPSPWVHQDIGPVGFAGDATYAAGVFTLAASGIDIWNSEDSFHFVSRELDGDAVLTARVTGFGDIDPYTFGGVMIRETLDSDSRNVMVGCTGENGVGFTRRSSTGGLTVNTPGANADAPYWVRLERIGDIFYAYDSPDGVTWSLVGSDSVTMSGTVYAGLALTSADNTLLSTVTIENVLLLGPNVNNAPMANPDGVLRFMSQGVQTPAGVLLTNDMDVDEDVLSVANVSSPTPPGSVVVFTNGSVHYWPGPGGTNTGSYAYAVSDGRGGVATAFVTVAVQVDPPVIEVIGIETGQGGFLLSCEGVPGFTYTVQFTDSLLLINWQTLSVVVADELGHLEALDSSPGNGPARFYRALRGVAP